MGQSYRIGRVEVLIQDGPLDSPGHLWLGCVNNKGYPSAFREGRSVLLHRWLYEQEHGEIEKGHHVHHRCNQRRCVNLDHLEATSPAAHNRSHTENPLAPRILELLADGTEWTTVQLWRELGHRERELSAVHVTLRRCRKLGEVERTLLGWRAAA